MTKIILLGFACIIGLTLSTSAQNLEELEKQYENVRAIVEQSDRILDSLKNILGNRAKQIETEKQKQNPDNDKIVMLMSGSVSLSNLIDDYREELETNAKNLKQISRILVNRYSTKIDSLQLLKRNTGKNADKLDNEILFFSQKRLLVSPQVELLSFNPQKILEIDLNKTKNNDERASLIEYLSSALTEVNSVLSDITKQAKETDDALILQKKTSKFIAETEFDRDIKITMPQKSSGFRNDGNIYLGNDLRLDVAEQINSYALLLNQLGVLDKSDIANVKKFNYKTGDGNLDMKGYSRILKEVIQKLNDYKLILTNKIEKSK